MEHVAELDRFLELAPAAPEIFSYVQSHPALQRHSPTFEYGMVDRQSARALAKFACVNCPTCRTGVIWVTAATRIDGTSVISHSIGSMD